MDGATAGLAQTYAQGKGLYDVVKILVPEAIDVKSVESVNTAGWDTTSAMLLSGKAEAALSFLEKDHSLCRNLTEINLSNCGLTEIPESLGFISTLTHLDLTNNQLKGLPRSFLKLPIDTTLLLKGIASDLQIGNADLPIRDLKSWRTWLEELAKGKIYPRSYKLVMVGAEGVGKSC